MTIAPRQHPHFTRRQGFSLAEVMFAMAITAFALLALIGVLPEGLQSLQNAQRREAEARIVQHFAAQYQLRAWDSLSSALQQNNDLDFDANGALITDGGRDTIYRARAEVMNAAPLPNETTASPYLRRVRVRITNRVGNGSALDDENLYHERWLSLVNLEKTGVIAPAAVAPDLPGTTSSTTTGTTANP